MPRQLRDDTSSFQAEQEPTVLMNGQDVDETYCDCYRCHCVAFTSCTAEQLFGIQTLKRHVNSSLLQHLTVLCRQQHMPRQIYHTMRSSQAVGSTPSSAMLQL